MDRADRQLLKKEAKGFGVKVSDEQMEIFSTYLRELQEWNRRLNLTGARNTTDMVRDLMLDSLVAVTFLPPNGALLDIGSGAGIPGLVLKIARPDLEVHLLEARQKKAVFLKHIVRELGLKGIAVFKGRAGETSGIPGLYQFYNIVTVRALASLKVSIDICSPYLNTGGILITFKGYDVEQEILEGREQMEKAGLKLIQVLPYTLPGKKKKRHLLVSKNKDK